ncbi:hypothetical protein CC117_25715 [Parafrankia colletiae]|uniref:Uncharacterized protein n=1 Tax=Parafrankia colletiae TaxID=573497 RepID=A0A1S1QEF9_9ACTN|nr:hypothetical protein [Parafrankia colletiae]MCK9903588.1 hypothetical protein [Frankia sp. Cpl3]OHV31615.1 hypothetical protein CC117_25715 [Parafrankia colletiae]
MKMLGRKAFYVHGVAGQSCCRAGCCSETAHQGRLGYKRHVKRVEQRQTAQEIGAGIGEYRLAVNPDTSETNSHGCRAER